MDWLISNIESIVGPRRSFVRLSGSVGRSVGQSVGRGVGHLFGSLYTPTCVVSLSRFQGLLRPESTGAFLEDLFMSSEGTVVVRPLVAGSSSATPPPSSSSDLPDLCLLSLISTPS